MSTSFGGKKVDVSQAKDTGFTPLPGGWYDAVLQECTVTEKDWGMSAKVKFLITAPAAFAGRTVFDNLVITHATSEQAQNIGQGRLKKWCQALNIDENLDGMDPFMGREVGVKIRLDDAREDKKTGKTYGPQNRVETFRGPGLDMSAPVARPVTPASTPRVAAPSAPAAVVAPAQAAANRPLPSWLQHKA